MKRYIKVNGKWIDTQAQQQEWGRHYRLEVSETEETKVYYYSDEYRQDYYVGILEDQSDEPQPIYQVKWTTYIQYEDIWGEQGELEEDEEIVECFNTEEEAKKEADKDKYGCCGQYVEVRINEKYYRDYEVE